jgi:hypothetical protein
MCTFFALKYNLGLLKLLLAIVFFIVLIPLTYFFLGLIILKSYLFFFFFVIGTIVSLRKKQYYIYLLIPLLYVAMLFGLGLRANYDASNITSEIFNYWHRIEHYLSVAGNYNLATRGVPLISQERYGLFVYPFISIFVVMGVVWCGQTIQKTFSNRQSKVITTYFAISIILLFSFFNTFQFFSVKEKYQRLDNLHPVYKAGFFLRAHKNSLSDTVLIYDFCDPTQGSFLSDFMVFSGISNIYTKVCDKCTALVSGSYPNRLIVDATPIIDSASISKINPQRNFKFRWGNLDYSFMMKNKREVNALFKMPYQHLLNKYSIDYLISKKTITLKHLKLLSTIEGYKIYRFVPHL